MTLSVALPTYNGAKHFRAQLDSIAAQARRPDELVIVDDASSDATVAIARDFAASAPFPVRIEVNQTGLGLNGNFARAISLCGCDVIALSDQDDVWLPRHLAALAEPFGQDAEVSLVVSNSSYVDEALAPGGTDLWGVARFDAGDARRVARGPQFRQWARHRVFAGHALAFRADLRPILLPFGLSMYDHWITLLCAAFGRVRVTDEVVTLHRRHARQTHGSRPVSLAEQATANASIGQSYFDGQIADWTLIAERLEAFRDRLWDREAIAAAGERIDSLRRRAEMRRGGTARRIAMAATTLLSGDYHRNGRGFLTFARDVRG